MIGAILAGLQPMIRKNGYFSLETSDGRRLNEDAINNIIDTKYVVANTSFEEEYVSARDIQNTCENIRMNDDGCYIWIYQADYLLIRFTTIDFINGLLDMLNIFKVLYTDVLLTSPLQISTINGLRQAQYFEIEGYPLPFLPIAHHGRLLSNPPDATYNLCDNILNRR